jgi:hypothetical protein
MPVRWAAGANGVNWEAIGAIAELVGAVGVIVSLGYLASQIRSSNRLSRSEATLAAAAQFGGFIDNLLADPELNAIFLRARSGVADLKNEEYQRFATLALKAFYFFSSQHFQYRTGTLDEDEWQQSHRLLIWWLAGSGVREWWASFGRDLATNGFRDFVDSEIRSLPRTSE